MLSLSSIKNIDERKYIFHLSLYNFNSFSRNPSLVGNM